MLPTSQKVKPLLRTMGITYSDSKSKWTTSQWLAAIIRHIATENGVELEADFQVGNKVKDYIDIVWSIPETLMTKAQWKLFADTFQWEDTSYTWSRGALKANILATLIYGNRMSFYGDEIRAFINKYASIIHLETMKNNFEIENKVIPLPGNMLLVAAAKAGLLNYPNADMFSTRTYV